jgi:hypothetical protein
MVATVPHIRVDLLGWLLNGSEKWSCGFSTAPEVSPTRAMMEDYASTASTQFQAQFWGSADIQPLFPSSVWFIGTRASAIDGDGHVVASGESMLATPDAATGLTAAPPQCAIVASLRTSESGPRGRGRMYLPCPANASLDSQGRLLTAARESINLRMQDFFDTWNLEPGKFPVAVASSAGMYVSTVNSVSVGSTIDTQRRRRDNLPEIREWLPVTA